MEYCIVECSFDLFVFFFFCFTMCIEWEQHRNRRRHRLRHRNREAAARGSLFTFLSEFSYFLMFGNIVVAQSRDASCVCVCVWTVEVDGGHNFRRGIRGSRRCIKIALTSHRQEKSCAMGRHMWRQLVKIHTHTLDVL